MSIESPLAPLPRDAWSRRRIVVLALAVFTLVCGIAWVSKTRWVRTRPEAPAASRTVATPRAEAVRAASAPVADAGTPSPVSARLQREFVEATDLYAFAENARRRPHEGGILYAEAASSYCRFANERVEQEIRDARDEATVDAGPVDAHRAAVLDRYARRCAGFRQLDVGAYWRELDRTSGEDPLIEAGRALSRASKAGDVDGRLAATQGFIDLHDPLLLSTKFAYLMNPDRVDGGPVGGLWFEGHDYRPVVDEYGRYVTALELAGCRPGAPCGTDSLMILSCQYRGVCLESIDADPFANDPTLDAAARARSWSEVLTLTGRMRAALGRGDLDAFRAPPVARH